MDIKNVDDRDWEIKLKTALAEPQPMYKKMRKTFLFVRTAIDSHLNKISALFTQDIEFLIEDIEEFAPLYMRFVEPRQLNRRVFVDGTIVYIDLKKGTSQAMTVNVQLAQTVYHVKIKKIGPETKISEKEAQKMVDEKKIFRTLQNDLPMSKNQEIRTPAYR